MAGKDKGKDEELEVDEDKKPAANKMVLIIAGVLLSIGIGVIATYLFIGGGEEDGVAAETAAEDSGKKKGKKKGKKDEVLGEAIYYRLSKPFIISFRDTDKQRYLQVNVAIKGRDQAAIDMLKKHLPVIKNNLNQVFGSREMQELQSYEGLQQLNKDATEVVQTFLEKETGSPGIEQVLFTGFVMQ